MANSGQFSLTIPLMKTWQDTDGRMCFEGVAASTSLDRQQERMTPAAIEKMQQYTNIDLLPSHGAGALEELGLVERCWIDNNQFRIAGYLEPDNPEALRLYEKLRAGKRYGLSIGGRVLKVHWQYDKEVGKQIKYIDDATLDHIAICRPMQAANPDTYLSILAKAADEVMDEQVDEGAQDAIFARLGKTIVEACQRIWPFGPNEQPLAKADENGLSQQGAKADDAIVALLSELQEQVESLDKAVEQLRKDTKEPDEEKQVQITPGRPQSIPGQTVTQAHKHEIWNGVL